MLQKIINLLEKKCNGKISNLVLAGAKEGITVVKLKGDASTRSYWRVKDERGNLLIIMELNLALKGSEEGVTFNKVGAETEYSFVNIHRLLKAIKIDVPEIYYYNEKFGVLLLEDAGDKLLQYHLEGAADDEFLSSYKKALDALVSLQIDSMNAANKEKCYAFHRKFDIELYDLEFNHFIEYGLKQVKEYDTQNSRKMSEKEVLKLKEEFHKISVSLAAEKYYFTHRDYHSRNILVHNGRQVIIDFQDALLAPLHYDLASLLRDAYITIPENVIDKLLEHYIRLVESKENIKINRNQFRMIFDYMSLQRNLKAWGRFEFIDKVKKNNGFLQYIPRLKGFAKTNLTKYKELDPIYKLIEKYCGDF